MIVGGITTLRGQANTTTISNTGTLGVQGLTTLGVVSTNSISNSGNISTNTLNAGQISSIYSYTDLAEARLIQVSETIVFPQAVIYDSNDQASFGSFRYSTLTTLFALPNTSLLYFNDLVVGGAYVWPGQTISALDWTSLYTFGAPPSNYILVGATASGGAFSNSIFNDITGGTPPYAVISITPNDIMTIGKLGFGNGANAGVVLYNSSVVGSSQTSPSNVIFTLADSSSPRFQRTVEYYWQIGPPAL